MNKKNQDNALLNRVLKLSDTSIYNVMNYRTGGNSSVWPKMTQYSIPY